jgi:hypothetical protein
MLSRRQPVVLFRAEHLGVQEVETRIAELSWDCFMVDCTRQPRPVPKNIVSWRSAKRLCAKVRTTVRNPAFTRQRALRYRTGRSMRASEVSVER